uniref:integrin-binding sialoprotein-like n=1 Tax=Semicossyphus pulcher TaxID=241346 RepID=UPI0037E8D09F
SDKTVLILAFILFGLIVLLIFLYKKLNKEANGEYTIRRIVYKEGGVRDRVRGVALALETRLGVQLWPRSDSNEDGEEMEEMEIDDEERQVEKGTSHGSDSEGEDQEEEEDEEEEEEERTGDGGDTSGDNSSLKSSEAGETARLMDQPEAKGEIGEKREEKEVKFGDGEGEGEGEASGGPGLLIDLKQFSGSATWSEGGVCRDGDVTAL